MKDFFKELFDYTHYCNNSVVAAIVENHDKVSQKTIQLMNHIINVHQIWNAKFEEGKLTPAAPWAVHNLNELADLELRNYSDSLTIIENKELDSPVEWTTTTGGSFTNSTQDILFQIINHANYHRAQIATEFRQAGLAPLLTDFIYYKMVKPQYSSLS